jgi:Na+/proline symporter
MVVDVLQLALYIACALLGIYLVSSLMHVSIPDIYNRIPADKLKIFSLGCDGGWSGLFRGYNIFSGILAGAILSFASHGTDHLIVQRVLACGDTGSAQKAMIASGLMIIFQFGLFMVLGLYISEFYHGATFARSDEIIPHFIANYVPDGYRGLMLAGIFATAMSTHASAINSLSSSTVIDLFELRKKD